MPESFCTDFSQWCASRPAWGYFQVVLDDQRWVYRVIERAINLRSRLFRNPTGDQALIISQPVFQHLGGYHTLPLMEDVAITDQLRSHYLPKVMRNPVVTSSRRWQTRGVLNTVLLMWKIRLLYRLGESPSKLAKLYR